MKEIAWNTLKTKDKRIWNALRALKDKP